MSPFAAISSKSRSPRESVSEKRSSSARRTSRIRSPFSASSGYHDVGQPPQVVEPDLARLLHRAADDPAQDVPAPLVRGRDAVADEERHAAAVVGEHAVRLRRGLVGIPGDAALRLDPRHDRLVAVRLVDRADALHDRGQPLDAHARVDVLRGKRRQRPVRVQLVLHEDEVPELEEAVAARTGGRAARIAAAVLLAPVVVDLGVGPARPGAAY
jgi:hypothetical protein